MAVLVFTMYGLPSYGAEPGRNKSSDKASPEKVHIPSFLTLGSFNTNGSMYLECKFEASDSLLRCLTTYVSVSGLSDKQKGKLRSDLADLDKATDKDISKLREFYRALDPSKAKKRFEVATPEQKAYMADYLKASEEVAAAKDKNSLKTAISKLNELDESTCNVSIQRGETTFRRAGANRWVDNPGPQGLCNIVTVQVFEQNSEHKSLWTLTQTTLSGDVERPMCSFVKESLNKPWTFSWDAPKSLSLKCRYLHYE